MGDGALPGEPTEGAARGLAGALPTRPLVALLALALWLGAALLFAAAVAPSAFAVLPSRALAGALVGRVLPIVLWSGVAVGALAAVLSWLDRARPDALPRALAAFVTAAACAVAQLVLGPKIQALRASIGASLDALPPGDARRVAFGRLHGFSVMLMGVGMLAAVAAIALTIVALRARR